MSSRDETVYILVNAARCHSCRIVVRSTDEENAKTCRCGGLTVAGGSITLSRYGTSRYDEMAVWGIPKEESNGTT